MITTKYTYPLPNDGSGYSFSEKELVKLLDSVYDKGFQDGVSVTDISETTYASVGTECMIVYDREAGYLNNMFYKEPFKVVNARKKRTKK